MSVTEHIEELEAEALEAISASDTTAELEKARVRFLGRSATLTEIKKSIGTLSPDDEKKSGSLQT